MCSYGVSGPTSVPQSFLRTFLKLCSNSVHFKKICQLNKRSQNVKNTTLDMQSELRWTRRATSFFILQTSFFNVHCSFFKLHCSFFNVHSSNFILHSSMFILQTSFFNVHSSFFKLHCSLFRLLSRLLTQWSAARVRWMTGSKPNHKHG